MSEEVDRRLTDNVGKLMRLRPDEWKSGEIAWIVATEGDPRVVAGMLQQIRQDKLGGRAVKVVVVGEDGESRVEVVVVGEDGESRVEVVGGPRSNENA